MSLQYSPVFKSHSCAMGKQCMQSGYQVKYFFAEQYERMLPDEIIKQSVFVGNSHDLTSSLINGMSIDIRRQIVSEFRKKAPDYIYMHNIQPLLNLYVARLAAKYHSIYIQHIHEPYFENKKVHGKFHMQLWWYLFEYFQGIILNNTDVAILSSNEAMALFEKRYRGFRGKKIKIPLMYEDLGSTFKDAATRKYITFIGPPVPSKGPEILKRIARWAAENNLPLKFLLISRKNIDDPDLLNLPNIQIYSKKMISDGEIGDQIRNSLMTITPYKTAKQSSVALTSYMYGTPVISTNVGGLPEVIHHLKTGYLLNPDSTVEEWITGINYIKEHLPRMSTECRNYFVDNFSSVNWPRYFDQLFTRNSFQNENIYQIKIAP